MVAVMLTNLNVFPTGQYGRVAEITSADARFRFRDSYLDKGSIIRVIAQYGVNGNTVIEILKRGTIVLGKTMAHAVKIMPIPFKE
jgi:Fe2+ transport system protein FeoA